MQVSARLAFARALSLPKHHLNHLFKHLNSEEFLQTQQGTKKSEVFLPSRQRPPNLGRVLTKSGTNQQTRKRSYQLSNKPTNSEEFLRTRQRPPKLGRVLTNSATNQKLGRVLTISATTSQTRKSSYELCNDLPTRKIS